MLSATALLFLSAHRNPPSGDSYGRDLEKMCFDHVNTKKDDGDEITVTNTSMQEVVQAMELIEVFRLYEG